jgi:hypothetical protein
MNVKSFVQRHRVVLSRPIPFLLDFSLVRSQKERASVMKKMRNDQAAALWHRAGNAGAAVAVDTRPKSIPNKKLRNKRKQAKAALRKEHIG